MSQSLAKKIQSLIGINNVCIISQDNYYKDRSHISELRDRFSGDLEDPTSIDFDLLIAHIQALSDNKPIEMPIFDIKTATREKNVIIINPTKFLVVEGHLIFSNSNLTKLFGLRVFIDLPLDVCLSRRIKRQQMEQPESALQYTLNNYDERIRPSYKKFIKPYKELADVIISNNVDRFIYLLKLISHGQLDKNQFFKSISPSSILIDDCNTVLRSKL